MNTLVKRVRDLDAAARKKVEEGLQVKLTDDMAIRVEPLDSMDEATDPASKYNFYRGLTDDEVEEVERAILKRDDIERFAG